jgi:hypothetical protein
MISDLWSKILADWHPLELVKNNLLTEHAGGRHGNQNPVERRGLRSSAAGGAACTKRRTGSGLCVVVMVAGWGA